jgi:predicted nucleic acid-binding protein
VNRRRYVETSALLRALLEGDGELHRELSGEGLVTSAVTFVEASRAVARARRERRLDLRAAREVGRQLAAFERACDVLTLDEEVLRRAREEFPAEPVRSLDALHLASIVVLDEQLGGVEVVSCDERVRRNAAALGFVLLPAARDP